MARNYKKNTKHTTERVEDSGLTITQERVAASLAAGLSITKISQETGVPPSTIYDWRQQATFATHYKKLQREAVREARGQIAQLASLALETIREMIESGGEQTKLKAACYVIDMMTGNERENKKLKMKAQSMVANGKK